MDNKSKSVKVYWIDAVIYSASSVPKKLELKPTRKTTEGILLKESTEWVIVRNPQTVTLEDGKRDSREQKKRKATFLYIPRGMIEKIEFEPCCKDIHGGTKGSKSVLSQRLKKFFSLKKS